MSRAVEVINFKTNRRMMLYLKSIVCFADRGSGQTEIHCIHRGVFRIAMEYDKFVEMLVDEKQLTYFASEDYDDEKTIP